MLGCTFAKHKLARPSLSQFEVADSRYAIGFLPFTTAGDVFRALGALGRIKAHKTYPLY